VLAASSVKTTYWCYFLDWTCNFIVPAGKLHRVFWVNH